MSRRIKPTAKILANEELRYGFELQNNARLSLSSEHLDKELERSPPAREEPDQSTVVAVILRNEKEAAALAAADTSPVLASNGKSVKQLTKQAPLVTTNISRSSPPKRPPCPDPLDFLNTIKLEKINLNRSPEDNKKLNIKQKKRLIKLKEKHFNKLGLQRATVNRSNSNSFTESSESDDIEEFVPNKKIKVGRPSVTLRVRSNRDTSQDKYLPNTPPRTPGRKSKSIDRSSPLVGVPPKFKPSSSPAAVKRSAAVAVESPLQRSHENSLILSTKHKSSIVDTMARPPSCPIENYANIKQEQDITICLCNKSSKYYTQKTIDTTYCRAVDEIETQLVGCSNEVDAELINLLRPSVRVSYTILCESHRKRLQAHHSCAGCGIFCTQGKFILCTRNHLFHRDCASKFILNAPFNPNNPSIFECPTLVLKCPHCGADAPEEESIITMNCTRVPVFVPFQRQSCTKTAKISIGQHSHRSGLTKSKTFLLELEKIIPQSVVDVVVAAQNNFPFSRTTSYTNKDVFYAINKNDVERVAEIIGKRYGFLCNWLI